MVSDSDIGSYTGTVPPEPPDGSIVSVITDVAGHLDEYILQRDDHRVDAPKHPGGQWWTAGEREKMPWEKACRPANGYLGERITVIREGPA